MTARRIMQPPAPLVIARRLASVALLVVVALLLRSEQAFSLEREDRQRALLATVQVVVPDESGAPTSAGSGTVLDADRGLILTNYHVMGDRLSGKLFNSEGLAVIGVNPPNLRGVPVFRYYAKVLRADPEVDLALLQIFAPFEDINAALPANLGLTSVDRGASGALEIGDPIYVLGFPGLGGDTVTYTEGIVSGFLDEDRDGVEEWIKTDAEVNHGNSGGLAVDDTGNFVGVPSAGYTDAESAGKISLIRPGDLALTYYDSWMVSSSQQGQNTSRPEANASASANTAQVSAVAFGTGIGDDGKVTGEAVRFPGGTTTLYASFDFRNIQRTDGLDWTWYVDNAVLDAGSVRLGRRESGSDWLSVTGAGGLANGNYQLEIRSGSVTLYRGGVQIGEAQTSNVTIGALTFAAGVDENGAPIGAATSFANLHEVFALFDATTLRSGMVVKTIWYFDDSEVLVDESPWTDDDMTIGWVSIRHPDGMPVGAYRLEILVDGVQVQSGVFRVTDRTDATVETVQVVGEVRDVDNTRRMISGALVILLQPGTSIQAWIDSGYSDALIYARGASNRSGAYQLDKRIETGTAYAVVVVQDDYKAVTQDDYPIPANGVDPYVLDVTMQRK